VVKEPIRKVLDRLKARNDSEKSLKISFCMAVEVMANVTLEMREATPVDQRVLIYQLLQRLMNRTANGCLIEMVCGLMAGFGGIDPLDVLAADIPEGYDDLANQEMLVALSNWLWRELDQEFEEGDV
jgi:hypothetical protein